MNLGLVSRATRTVNFDINRENLIESWSLKKISWKNITNLLQKFRKFQIFVISTLRTSRGRPQGWWSCKNASKSCYCWILLLFFSRFSSITGVGIIPKMPLTLEGQVWLTMYLLSKSLSKLRLTCLNTMGSLRNYVTQDIEIVELPHPMSNLVTIRLESPPSFHTPKIDKLRAENELSLDANFRSHIC